MILIDSPNALQRLARDLRDVPAIGVDTEANSFYVYHERTCLVQISTREEDYLVDPLALRDLSPLRPVFAGPAVTKIFHAADNDVAALKRDFGIETRRLFDTMVSARILGLPRYGLGDLLREFFGVESDKRMQRYNWGERPLNPAAMEYAAMDTHYLLPLADLLSARLVAQARMEEAEEEFKRLEQAEAAARVFDTENFWRVKGAYDLAPQQQAVLRELYIWRDGRAETADRPPFRVVPDSLLLQLALQRPHNQHELERLAGVTPLIAARYGSGILSAIVRGEGMPAPKDPRVRRRDDAYIARYEALRTWRRQVAAQRGVEPDVVVSNAVLSSLAARMPRTEAELQSLELLGSWKLRTYGPAMLRVLQEVAGAS